ncbi:MAG: DUF192 domain-containing protein [Dehalococcoidia bacterium]
MRLWLAVGAVLLAALMVGCSSDKESSGGVAQAQSPAGGLPVLTFTTSSGETVPLAVEVADDSDEMSCGLMHRTELADDQGMLFAYTSDTSGGFWMRNTLIPLAIAYVGADGRIVDILEMEPVPGPGYTPFQSPDGSMLAIADGHASYRRPDGSIVVVADGQPAPQDAVRVTLPWVTYPPRAPYRYVVEANQGWFDRHGIAVGDQVDVSPALADADAAVPPSICVERGL